MCVGKIQYHRDTILRLTIFMCSSKHWLALSALAAAAMVGYALAGPHGRQHAASGDADDAAAVVVAGGVRVSTANTGKLFAGGVVRHFPAGESRFSQFWRPPPSQVSTAAATSSSSSTLWCDRWAVTTTISEPSEGVRRTSWRDGWCTVVVADRKGPADWAAWLHGGAGSYLRNESTVYLTVGEQEILAHRSPFISAIPWNHFARKNVGYLYAILHGAKEVFDYDDDNLLYKGSPIVTGLDPSSPSGRRSPDDKAQHSVRHSIQHGTLRNALTLEAAVTAPEVVVRNSNGSSISGHVSLNPYPLMGATNVAAWPRGLPYFDVRRSPPPLLGLRSCVNASRDVPAASLGVIQSLADHDPDVDGVYRLTQPIHFYFPRNGPSVVVPTRRLAPYNAQATLHTHNALWALLLPASVHGRVSDIWRGYLAQRLFWDIGLRLAFAPPSVWQERNPHNWLADMNAEQQLYERAGKLLDFLVGWECDGNGSSSLPTFVEALWVAAYERGYLERSDVVMVQRWLQALLDAHYPFPLRLPRAERERHERAERADWAKALDDAKAASAAAASTTASAATSSAHHPSAGAKGKHTRADPRPLSAAAYASASALSGTLPIDVVCEPAGQDGTQVAPPSITSNVEGHTSNDGASRAPTAGVPRYGRTAICLTGFARTLFARFPEGIEPRSTKRAPNAHRLKWYENFTWAGSRKVDGSLPGSEDWIVAHALRHKHQTL